MRRFVLPCLLSVALIPVFTGCGSGSPSSPSSPTQNPVPAVTSISPATVTAGAPAQTIVVTGTNFLASSVVNLNGAALPTTFTSSTSLSAAVPASALAAGATATLTVANPSPGGGASPATTFTIMSPTPAVSGLSPATVPQGQAVTVTVAGTGFEANSSVLWNGSPRSTTFVSGTSLQVALTAADVQAFGVGQISVTNPGPGGSTTAAINLPVVSPPVITAVIPASVLAGSPSQTLTLTGTGFLSTSSIALDGVVLQTTFTSATSLQATVPAADLTNSRVGSLTVFNGPTNGGLSAVFHFNITSSAPTLTALTPASVVQGAAATITLTGTGFEPNSAALWNGSVRTSTFVSSTSLQVALTAADLSGAGTGSLTVSNPAPGGGTSAPATLTIVVPPVITALSPSSIPFVAPQYPASTATANLTITGTGFAPTATVSLSGISLTITSQTATQIVATVPATALGYSGPTQVVVTNPAIAGLPGLSSGPATLNIINPSATFSVSPVSAAINSPDTTITIYGQAFFSDSIITWNGISLQTTYSNSGSLSAVVPAALLASPGTAILSVATPENLGATAATQPFSTYVALPVNDIAWSGRDNLIYATVPGVGGPGLGNSLVGVDPNTGKVIKTIFVGSEPNRLALSDDGTRAFVGLDSAGSIREINLQTNTAGLQFSLGGGPGVYNPPFTAESIAVVPGHPDSLAVYSSSGIVTIYDAGVARPKTSSGLQTYFSSNYGGLAFGASASTLYVSSEAIGSYVYTLSVDSTGITSSTQLSTSGSGRTLQYDNDRLYFPVGVVADATTGITLGTFSTNSPYSSGTSPAIGPIVSDSTLNRAFVLSLGYGSSGQILSFDEGSFNPISSLGVTGVGASNFGGANDLIRWGQTGLAFHSSNQLYIVQGSLVKDNTAAPADLELTSTLPATASTGTALNYQLQVKNLGPNAASGVALFASLPGSISFPSQATSSQGTCTVGGELVCDLGSLANGATATVTLAATPTSAGAAQSFATISAQTFDPVDTNNQATASTTVVGALFSPVPAVSSLSPNLVPTGTASFTLTVNGSNFTSASSVLWNNAALPTSFISGTQLTATVDSSLATAIGWASVSVSSAAPGGGQSAPLTISIYGLLNIPANAILYDPFTRKLIAALPSTSTPITGNSIVSIDPATGTLGTPIPVGSEPNLLAETSSGNFLYIGLSGADSVGQFNLVNQTLTGTFPLTSNSVFGSGPVAAGGLATLPGLDNSVSTASVGILDIANGTATVRPNSAVGYNTAVFPDATHVYTYNNQSSFFDFSRYNVDSAGIHLIDQSTLLGFGGFSGGFALDNGLVYASAGGIINPSTTPPSQVGVLPLGVGPYQSSLVGGGVVPYAAEAKSFNVGINDAGTALAFLERFDTQHFVLEDQIELPTGAFYGVNGTRWGQDGLAYILPPNIGASGASQIMLLRGAFVLPAEATSNPAPTLSAAGSGTLSAGSGNQYLTITGAGFLPGATVLWNGVAHTTNFVDVQHLSVAIPAADVAASGAVTLTCQNPGSAASGTITLTVH